MREFTIKEVTYKLPTSWDEISLKTYLDFYKRNSKRAKDEEVDDLYLIELVELFSGCDELLSLPASELVPLIESLGFLLKTPEMKKERVIKLEDGKIYSFIDVNLIMGDEYISIKEFQKQFSGVLDSIPYILSVILRPAVETINKETGETDYKIEEFNVQNLGWRVKNYPTMFKAIDVMQYITFFLTSISFLKKTTNSSTRKNTKKQTTGPLKSLNNLTGSR